MSEGFGHLSSLKELNLSDSRIEALPESETCCCIFYFFISNFGNLMSEGFGHLSSLKELNLSWSGIKALPESETHCCIFIFFISRYSEEDTKAMEAVFPSNDLAYRLTKG